VNAPSPITYNKASANEQTTKLASDRGKRSRINRATNGSRMKAIVSAIREVIKKSRPRYRIAMTTPKARMGRAM
jgi:hypothetical protein